MDTPRADRARRERQRPAVALAFAYLVLGGLWFGFSGAVLLSLAGSPEAVIQYQPLKGVAYVVITALLAYYYRVRKIRGHRDVLEAGCSGYIEKPINPETSMTEVERHLLTGTRQDGGAQ